MFKFSFVLLCLACRSHGRGNALAEPSHSTPDLRVLSALLFTQQKPAAAYHPMGLGTCCGTSRPSFGRQNSWAGRPLNGLFAHRARFLRLCSTTSSPFFFDPLQRFQIQEPERPPPATLPLLIVLPGLDGSGITAWTQYPELGLEYDIKAMCVPANDRSDFQSIVDMVAVEVVQARSTGREVYVLGESMGAGIALQAAVRENPAAAPTGLVLVAPATGWDRTWLGRSRNQLLTLPDWALSLVILLTSYQLLDLEQFLTTLRRIFTGERAPILNTPQRLQYTWNVVRAMPEAFGQPAGTTRHRVQTWVEPILKVGREFSQLSLPPTLIVAGTADLRVPAEEEALRLQAAAKGPLDVHLVPSAGHAGVTDDRINFRDVMGSWRKSRILKTDAQAA